MTHDNDEKLISAKAPFDLVAALDAADEALDGQEGSIRIMFGPKGEQDYVLAHKRTGDDRVHARFAIGAPK